MYKFSLLILFIGLAWGQPLKLANTKGDTIVIKQGERFILNNFSAKLNKVDYQNQTVSVKRKSLFYRKDIEVRFDEIRSINYLKHPFNIVGLLFGGGIGGYLFFYTNLDYGLGIDFVSQVMGKSFAILGGITSILIPTYSQVIYLDDNKWYII
tara:strand:+ start:217 stop:675 length:459 start_codon:yes stop_codon:yes gene_type:complete